MSRVMVLGGFDLFDSPGEDLLFLLTWTLFCGFLSFVGIIKTL